MALWQILAPIAAYVLFVAVRLGFHQRLPLAFGPISLDRIPDRAAQKYGERVLFTSDRPCAWEVPALRERYTNRAEWSASRIRCTAGYLSRLLQEQIGMRRGDRVAILKENHLDIHIFVLAVIRAGGIACPINGKFASDKLHPYLLNLDAKVLITDSKTLLRLAGEDAELGRVERIIIAEPRDARVERAARPGVQFVWLEEALMDVREEGVPVRRGKDEPLMLVHSSGTTGFPKAVILKNGPQSHAVRGWLCYVIASRGWDKGFMAVPNNHQAVILSFHGLLLLGLRIHWTGAYDRDGFDAGSVVRELADGRFTGFFGFPITYTQLREVDLDGHDLSRMRFWASTADASHEALQRPFVCVGGAFRRIGIPFRGSVYLDAQGSSEVGTPSVIRFVTPFTKKFARRVGRPGSTPFGPKIRIATRTGERVRRGEVGRLEVKGRTVFDGYWNHHILTFEAIRDGWFFTGDVARQERDGHIVQLDREVDVIHTRVGAVYSLPIEEKVHKHPAVFDACVYAERQADGTQLPAAAIALRSGFAVSTEQLRLELNGLLSKEEWLHRLDILPWDEFPMGITGKTLKRIFRERTEAAAPEERNRPIILDLSPDSIAVEAPPPVSPTSGAA